MDKKLLKEEYKRLLTKAIEGRPGGMALMIVLEETDFYNSPASAKHHLNVPGGLCCTRSTWQGLHWNCARICRSLRGAIRTQSLLQPCSTTFAKPEITSRNRMEAISIEIRICWGMVKRP